MGGIAIWPLLVFILLHVVGNRLKFLMGIPRSVWLSAAGGVSVAYVFMHLFPELHEGQQYIERVSSWTESIFRDHVYMVALIGLVVFYGLERAVVILKKKEVDPRQSNKHGIRAFWLHIGSFSLYNALIGYLLVQREEGDERWMIVFTVAIGLHLLVNDLALLDRHKEAYFRYGRWCLVAALATGWFLGLWIDLDKVLVIMITAFIGGGIIMNVLKEELPQDRESRYWAFLLGVGAYTLLLMLI